MQKSSMVLVGVGGQGILFTTTVLSTTALRLGLEVIGSETHGMSQRGGSVISHLRIGGGSPLVRRGTADILLALDVKEAYKSLDYLREGGLCIINVPDGRFPHSQMSGYIEQHRLRCHTVDADQIARELNIPAIANTALLGFASSLDDFTFSHDQITETITGLSKPHLQAINQQALARGAQQARKHS